MSKNGSVDGRNTTTTRSAFAKGGGVTSSSSSGHGLGLPTRAPAGFGAAAHSIDDVGNVDSDPSGSGGTNGVYDFGRSVKGLTHKFETAEQPRDTTRTRYSGDVRPVSFYGGNVNLATQVQPRTHIREGSGSKKPAPPPPPKPSQFTAVKVTQSDYPSVTGGRAGKGNPRGAETGDKDVSTGVDPFSDDGPFSSSRGSDSSLQSNRRADPDTNNTFPHVVIQPSTGVASLAARIQALQAGGVSSGLPGSPSAPQRPSSYLPLPGRNSRPVSMMSNASSHSYTSQGRKHSPPPQVTLDLDGKGAGSAGQSGRSSTASRSRRASPPPTHNHVPAPVLPAPSPVPPLSLFNGPGPDLTSGSKASQQRAGTSPSGASASSLTPSLVRMGTDSIDGLTISSIIPGSANPDSEFQEDVPSPNEEEEADRDEKLRKKRINVTNEVIETEEVFVRDMEVLSDYFYTPSLHVLPSSTVLLIFSNLPALLAFSRNFLALIRIACERNPEGGQELADVFVRSAAQMEDVYGEWCGKSERAVAKVAEVMASARVRQGSASSSSSEEQLSERTGTPDPSVQLREFIKDQTKAMVDEGVTGAWDLAGILVKPVQRVLKYPLLVKSLVAATPPNHPSTRALNTALSLLTSLADKINSLKHRKDVTEKYARLARGATGSSSSLSSPPSTSKPDASSLLANRNPVHWAAKSYTRTAVAVRQTVGLADGKIDGVFEVVRENFENLDARVKQIKVEVVEWLKELQALLDAQERFILAMEEIYDFTPVAEVKNSSLKFVSKWQKYASSLARGPIIREVDDAINRKILPMLDGVIENLKGPAAVIKKRDKKRLDHERVKEQTNLGQKPSELLAESSANYELLNDQLLEEIPILRDLVNDYLDIVLVKFVDVQVRVYEALTGLSEVAADGEELGVVGVLAGSAQAGDWEGIRATFAARMSQVREVYEEMDIPREWTEETFSRK
ncbi:hypothetical protein HDU93_005263 [Gonapodya sp. JEL0774]|nr:hypothetical protein HDU93_005263 [Gonapodya sp. JEL0774]